MPTPVEMTNGRLRRNGQSAGVVTVSSGLCCSSLRGRRCIGTTVCGQMGFLPSTGAAHPVAIDAYRSRRV
jgi:hypothetical protein